MSDLTPRQLEAVTLLTEGLSNDEIALAMGVSFDRARKLLKGAATRAGYPELNRVLLAVWFTRRVSEAAWARLV